MYSYSLNSYSILPCLSLLVPFSCDSLSVRLCSLQPPAGSVHPQKFFQKNLGVRDHMCSWARPSERHGVCPPPPLPPGMPDSNPKDRDGQSGEMITLVQDSDFPAVEYAGAFFFWMKSRGVVRCQPGDKRGCVLQDLHSPVLFFSWSIKSLTYSSNMTVTDFLPRAFCFSFHFFWRSLSCVAGIYLLLQCYLQRLLVIR